MTLPPGGVPTDIAHRWVEAWAGTGGGQYGPAGAPLARVISPPYVWKPPHATDFNLFDTLEARDSANTPATFTGAELDIPPANVAVIRSISILANNLLTSSDIRWTLFFDESPVQGWDSLTINPRSAGSVEVSWTPAETFILTSEGSSIRWAVNVLDGGTYQLSIGFHGWYYPTTYGG